MTKHKITAVLGPTNTGKTFLAIETMLSFSSGMMGFPLRLLAREVYDKVVKKTDPNKVALITGEEKIIPSNAKYYFCTVESMPIEKDLEFVGIDEIQMCSDHERGHIFTYCSSIKNLLQIIDITFTKQPAIYFSISTYS